MKRLFLIIGFLLFAINITYSETQDALDFKNQLKKEFTDCIWFEAYYNDVSVYFQELYSSINPEVEPTPLTSKEEKPNIKYLNFGPFTCYRFFENGTAIQYSRDEDREKEKYIVKEVPAVWNLEFEYTGDSPYLFKLTISMPTETIQYKSVILDYFYDWKMGRWSNTEKKFIEKKEIPIIDKDRIQLTYSQYYSGGNRISITIYDFVKLSDTEFEKLIQSVENEPFFTK